MRIKLIKPIKACTLAISTIVDHSRARIFFDASGILNFLLPRFKITSRDLKMPIEIHRVKSNHDGGLELVHTSYNNAAPPSDVKCKSQNFENYSLQTVFSIIIPYEKRKLIFCKGCEFI